MRNEDKKPSKIRGYTDTQSVAQGETIRFFVADVRATHDAEIAIRVSKLGLRNLEMLSDVGTVHAIAVPEDRGWENNHWDVSYTLKIGKTWPSGVYAAHIGDAAQDAQDIYFIVRSAQPGSASPIVVQIPTTTINAYNNWGGASLYAYNSRPSAAQAVSFDRPQQSDSLWPRGYGFDLEWNQRIKAFVQWLEAAGFSAEFISNDDLHASQDLLGAYRLFVSIGHDEYWSHEMRRNFDSFVATGGNAAILSGNTCYWQIRFESDEKTGAPCRRMVCYKSAEDDPVAERHLKTIAWRDLGLPENTSFGAGFAKGAWKGNGSYGVFKVHRPDHWVFSGTGLQRNDEFGDAEDEAVLGYETNGVDYVRDANGLPLPSGDDGTPMDYLILALADLPDWGAPGNAAMGIFRFPDFGGTVFNAATTDWAKGLESCVTLGEPYRTVTAKITRNVIARLARLDMV
jgi:hypothetical protein